MIIDKIWMRWYFCHLHSARHRVNSVLIANLRRTLWILLMRLFRSFNIVLFQFLAFFVLVHFLRMFSTNNWKPTACGSSRGVLRGVLCTVIIRGATYPKSFLSHPNWRLTVHTVPYNETILSSSWWYYCQRNMSRDAVHRDRTDDSSAKYLPQVCNPIHGVCVYVSLWMNFVKYWIALDAKLWDVCTIRTQVKLISSFWIRPIIWTVGIPIDLSFDDHYMSPLWPLTNFTYHSPVESQTIIS